MKIRFYLSTILFFTLILSHSNSFAGKGDVPGIPDISYEPYVQIVDDIISTSGLYRMEGVSGYIRGAVRDSIERMLSEEGRGWLCDAVAHAINRVKGEGGIKNPLSSVKDDPELKKRVRDEIKKRLKEKIPQIIKDTIEDRIFAAAVDPEHLEEARELTSRIVNELDVSMNDRIDAAAGQMYSELLDKVDDLLASNEFTSGIDPTDIRGTISAAFDLGNVSDIFMSQLSDLIGDASAQAISSRLTDALNGDLPPELIQALRYGPDKFNEYVEKFEEYLPGRMLQGVEGSVLNAPVIKIPTSAYAAVLSVTASGHFTRAFAGPVVDAYELRRGVEVTRVMVWQIANKDYINLTLMQLSSIAGNLAELIGAGEMLGDISSRFSSNIDRIQNLTDSIDGMLARPLNQVSTALHDLADKLKAELENFQEMLISPGRNFLEDVQGELDFARDTIFETLPENFNGLPEDFEDLKNLAGLEDGVLGEAGDLTPRDLMDKAGITDAAGRVRDGLEEALDSASGDIADLAANILDATGLLGPAAKILEVEKVPSKNEALSGSLDPVLLHNGEFYMEISDLMIPGVGLDFKFTRIYRGMSNFKGELGFRWTHSYAQRLLLSDDGLTYIDERGRKFLFEKSGSRYLCEELIDHKVEKGDDGFSMYFNDGRRKLFDDKGRIVSVRDRYGNELLFDYGNQGLLSAVIDTYGRRIKFKRNKDGFIEEVVDFSGRSFRYEYKKEELISVITPSVEGFSEGKRTRYIYNDNVPDGVEHVITGIVDPKRNEYLKNIYDAKGRVVAQKYGEGPEVRVRYSSENSGPVTKVRDKNGTWRVHRMDLSGRLIKLSRIKGDTEIVLEERSYDSFGRILRSCDASGLCRTFKYKGNDALPVRIDIHPAGGGKARTIRIERDDPFDRPTLITDESCVQISFKYKADYPHDLHKIKRKLCEDKKWQLIRSLNKNSCGRIVQDVNALGLQIKYEYYPWDSPHREPDWESVREGCGYLKNIDDGTSKKFIYDEVGNITKMMKGGDTIESYEVNSLNQVTEEKGPSHPLSRYIFDANDNLIKSVLGKDRISEQYFVYDELDKLIAIGKQVNENDFVETKYSYDPEENLIGIVGSDGDAKVYEYGDDGNLKCEIAAFDTIDRQRRCYEYDASGRVIVSIENDGGRTEYKRNGFGEIISVADADGNYKEYLRGDGGRIVSEKQIDSHGTLLSETKYDYGIYDKPLRIRQKLWSNNSDKYEWVVTKYEYDSAGNVVKIIHPNEGVTEIERDKHGRVILAKDPTGIVQTFIYNLEGALLESYFGPEDRKLKNKEYHYDAAGRLRSFSDGSVTPWEYRYDDFGWLKTMIDPYMNTTSIDRDRLGRIINRTQSLNGEDVTIDYEWNGTGRLTSVTDPAGDRTRYGYNAVGKLILEEYPNGSTRRFAYDASGFISGFIDRDGSSMTIARDFAGRPVRRDAVTAKGERVEQSFTYDGLGRLIEASEGDYMNEHFYDSLSRVITEKNGEKIVERIYDINSKLISMRADGDEIYFTRDISGRLEGILSKDKKYSSFEYDGAGDLIHQDFGDAGHMNISRSDSGRVYHKEYFGSDGRRLWSGELYFDDNDEIASSMTVEGVRRFYERDELRRLISVRDIENHAEFPETLKSWDYDLDLLGNVTNADHGEYGPAGRLISYDGKHFSYDAMGRLAKVILNAGDELNFSYDAFGRRVEKSSDGEKQNYLWDGWNLLSTFNVDSSKGYLYSDEGIAPIAKIEKGKPAYLITDERGSKVGSFTFNPILKSRCEYFPYGERYSCDADPDDFCFAGHTCDGASDLIYMHNRYYSPKLKKFITPDPLGYKISMHSAEGLKYAKGTSFHRLQGGASHATFANRPTMISGNYGVFPFDRILFKPTNDSGEGEMNLHLYARADPVRFYDPYGLASLIFDRSDEAMYLYDGNGYFVSQYLASNRVMSPESVPIQIGGNGPFSNGMHVLNVPEFYSKSYRDNFYSRFGFGDAVAGESVTNGDTWSGVRDEAANYNVSFGGIRMRVGERKGDPAFDRQLFIHGGRRNYLSRTKGCIRADDLELETLAANFIAFRRQNDPIDSLIVRE